MKGTGNFSLTLHELTICLFLRATGSQSGGAEAALQLSKRYMPGTVQHRKDSDANNLAPSIVEPLSVDGFRLGP